MNPSPLHRTFTATLFSFLVCNTSWSQGNIHTTNGVDPGDLSGWCVADAGDINQDGNPDFLVGSKIADNGTGALTGSVRVMSGWDNTVIYELFGQAHADFFGWAVSTAGDLDGDLIPDFLVGAPQEDMFLNEDGVVRAFSGADQSVLFTWSGPRGITDYGSAVADAGDVNMDGYPDIAVGAWKDHALGPLNSGTAFVYSGLDGSLLYEWYGDDAGDELGFCVASAGDTNNDGHADIIVSTLDDDNIVLDGGGARMFSGIDGSILKQWDGDGTADWYGYSVSTLGDVDNDGHDDVIVGGPRDDDNGPDSGTVKAFSGQDYSLLWEVDGPAGSRLGWSVADIADVNTDGVPDAILGAPWYNSQTGIVYVASGVDGATLATIYGPAYSNFGFFVSSAQDLNLDNVPDVLAGAPYADLGGNNSGSALVVSLECGDVVSYAAGCAGSGGFTPNLDMTGCLTPGGEGTMEIDSGLGGSLAFILVGTGQNPLQISGLGCPVDVAPLTPPRIVGFTLDGVGDGNGTKSFGVDVNMIVSGPLVRTLQLIVADPGGAGGYSTSNAIQITVN